MLIRLSIRDVVLIEALDLDFGAGLGVLTGETGAGKSILLDALGLALGGRSTSALVRHGAAQASVSASFEPSAAALAMLYDNGLEIEPGEPLIVRRTIKADGGSRAFINDQPVSAALLRDIGATLIEIHGQHDDRGLINPRGHRALLDSFARADTSSVAKAHGRVIAAQQAFETARTAIEDAERDREWLEHSVAELRAFAAEPGEEASLAERRAAMQRGEKIAAELDSVTDHVDGSSGGLASLRQAARILDRISEGDATLTEALAAVDRAIIEGSMADDLLREAARTLIFDPKRLDADEARLFELRGLARKHRVQPDDLAALTFDLSNKLGSIEAGSEGLAKLASEVKRSRDAYTQSARALHDRRVESATRLDTAVATELAPLKLDAARFRTIVAEQPEAHWGPHGIDRVEFEISTNPGAPFAPMIKIASGGELSRFILALKVALAEEGSAATMIFDEIDRGVGGAVASAIGERLSRLSRRAQLLVVTHSPQVAARGGSHWLIAKSHDGIVTRTSVSALNPGERREEIARMLSGAEVTDEARAQAVRLLDVH